MYDNMHKKQKYESPEAEIISFEDSDIITVSDSDTRMPAVTGNSGFNLF